MKSVFATVVALCLTIIGLTPAHAATLSGRVIVVPEGDTIVVIDANRTRHTVRLAAIDAPERNQTFGNRARACLAKWVYQRNVLIEWNRTDAGGRLLGVIIVDGHDVNLELVRAGCAWWQRDGAQAPDERDVYEQAEKAARERKLGLWGDPKPVPPWEWRPASTNSRERPS
jgi:endonuclease YncB( thermonuclease family)